MFSEEKWTENDIENLEQFKNANPSWLISEAYTAQSLLSASFGFFAAAVIAMYFNYTVTSVIILYISVFLMMGSFTENLKSKITESNMLLAKLIIARTSKLQGRE